MRLRDELLTVHFDQEQLCCDIEHRSNAPVPDGKPALDSLRFATHLDGLLSNCRANVAAVRGNRANPSHFKRMGSWGMESSKLEESHYCDGVVQTRSHLCDYFPGLPGSAGGRSMPSFRILRKSVLLWIPSSAAAATRE